MEQNSQDQFSNKEIQPKSPEKRKKFSFLFVFATLFTVFCIVLVVFSIYASYNNKTHSFSCGYIEKELPIPAYLQGATIKFKGPIYGGRNLNFGYTCVNTYSQIHQKGVNMLWPINDTLTSEKISPEEIFTVYKRLDVTCETIGCMDAGGATNQLLLKDRSGVVWNLAANNLNPKYFSKPYLFDAVYYKDGKEMGAVTF